MKELLEKIEQRIREIEARKGYCIETRELKYIQAEALAEQDRIIKELEAKRQEAKQKMDNYPDINSLEHLVGLSELTDYSHTILIIKGE